MTCLPVLVAFVWLGCVTQVHAQDPLFVPAPSSPVEVGAGSGQVVLADVSGDGYVDMLTRHLLTRIVTVQLGDGTGRFSAAADSPIVLRYPPGDMEIGDFNHDRALDLGILRSDRDSVDVLLGNGKGSFSLGAGSPFLVSTSVYTLTKPSLHLADVNEDGHLDFITANGRRDTFATLLGDGRGRLAPGPITRLGGDQDFYSVAFGDVDGDGHVDAVIAARETGSDLGRVVMQLGDGTGAFKAVPAPPLAVFSDPRVAALADMNGDQRLDIVISHSSDRLSILLNQGSGHFVPAPSSPYILGAQVFAAVIGDINHDRQVDIVAATANSRSPRFNSSVTVLLGDGRGYVPGPGSPFRAGPGAYNLTVGDVNKDGRPDVAASSFEGNAVTVLLGR